MAATDASQRIRDMEQQLRRMQAEQSKLRRDMERANAEQLKALEKRYKKLLQDHDRQTGETYRKALQEFQDEQQKLLRAHMARLEEHDRKALREQQELLQQLSEANRRLQEESQAIIRRTQEAEAAARSEAQQRCRSAESCCEQARQLPHQFFAPDQLPVLEEQVTTARRLMDQGMYEASAGAAITAAASIDVLSAQVRYDQQLWMQIYAQLARQLQQMKTLRNRFEASELASPYPRKLADADRAYWSSGLYPAVCRELEEACRVLAGDDGQVRFGDATPSRPMLQEQLSACRHLSARLEAAIVCIRGEARLSDERYFIGEALLEQAYQRGYDLLSIGFAPKDETEQPLDVYRIRVGLSDIVVTLSLIPWRDNGIAVQNLCHVQAECSGAASYAGLPAIRSAWQHTAAAVCAQLHKDGRIATAIRQEAGPAAPTPARPDPQQYIRRQSRRAAQQEA